ncbi:MAG: S24 family peptidase [Flavobacterium nitrogenifigens]|uniref:S24 family peptidase n=1 Tax=Flavobacterium nitrogenifigens TaxID=1617283 RepID=UPI00280A1FBF|nr:S24 family peptidase [Flavobacterium nitrogenifigens]MDQ8012007.1 S24 family peptidase [Flavobacterium nitrogenifigens]
MKAIERFYQYLDYKAIKPTKFEKENGLSNGYLGTQLRRNGSLGEDVLTTIINNCLDLNPIWLLSGKGLMTQNFSSEGEEESKKEKIEESTPKIFKMKTDKVIQKQMVPLYDIQASASVVALFRDKDSQQPVDHITIPNLPKCDGAIYVSGDSMYPLLKSGDIIMYKQVENALDSIFWGEMYLVSIINDYGDEFVMIKWLQRSEQGNDFVKLVSENRHHQPTEFHIKNIKGLALIKASIRINSMY